MSISRTILVILDIFVLLWLEAFGYIWQRIDPRYLKGAMTLYKAVYGNSNAGRMICIIILQLYRTIVEYIVIYKEKYIHDVRYVEYMKKVEKHLL